MKAIVSAPPREMRRAEGPIDICSADRRRLSFERYARELSGAQGAFPQFLPALHKAPFKKRYNPRTTAIRLSRSSALKSPRRTSSSISVTRSSTVKHRSPLRDRRRCRAIRAAAAVAGLRGAPLALVSRSARFDAPSAISVCNSSSPNSEVRQSIRAWTNSDMRIFTRRI
jgi:hypothetical protein